ncbi:hypothetical protein EW145_g7224 [Phellinidium pouzarii]|uniref:Uncharacterized protein n=1 Tax=Phellinidium pouzarii TaxID=167371 RepID=A0A4S4KRY2_9AGAM|nr:hypothetical protein EW145_g7224 [Phellinidium pouzarii]
MMELLKKFEDGEKELDNPLTDGSDDDGEGDVGEKDDLAERLGGVDLDAISPAELWEILTPAERTSFMSAVQDPQSESAQELLHSAGLQDEGALPWWEAPEAPEDEDEDETEIGQTVHGNTKKMKKHRRQPVLIQLPEALLQRPGGTDTGPLLLYNICAVLIAYAYTTRYLGKSPLTSKSTDTDLDAASVRQTMRNLVPFISDRRARALLESMDAVVTDMWPRLVDSEGEERTGSGAKAGRETVVLVLRDAARLLMPRRVAVFDNDNTVGEAGAGNNHNRNLETHPHRNFLRALSDLVVLFRHQGVEGAETKETPTSAKLLFYAAHVASLPTALLVGFSAEVAARAQRIESETEVAGKANDNPTNYSITDRGEPMEAVLPPFAREQTLEWNAKIEEL